MKRFFIGTLSLLTAFMLTVIPSSTQGQEKEARKSLKASVTQRLGIDTDITFDFSRPGMKGRKIWGDLVPYGMAPGNDYSEGKAYPWRAGANENTTIEFNNDLLVEGIKLPAGKYGIHMIPSEKDWIIIFSKNNAAWGSFAYNPEEDALRVTVQPVQAPHEEWLTYGFDDLAGTSATAFLHWVKIKVPFKIELTK
jgi:hypothetical protein